MDYEIDGKQYSPKGSKLKVLFWLVNTQSNYDSEALVNNIREANLISFTQLLGMETWGAILKPEQNYKSQGEQRSIFEDEESMFLEVKEISILDDEESLFLKEEENSFLKVQESSNVQELIL